MAAAHLSRQAPETWGQFMVALGEYANSRRDECVQSSVEKLQVAQGRAQICVQLVRLLADCNKTAEAIEKQGAHNAGR
jgi:hypothetical protein